MPDAPLPPDALDRLAREVGRERTRTESQGSTAFGWGTGAPAAIGRFRIMGPLGRGGMGVVYQAFDPDMNREVALKSLAAGPGDRLKREGEAIGRLEHPGIVRIYEMGEELGRPFLVMELVKGRHLDEAWAAWELKRRVAALKAVARAVAHAHARGVAHRDLKPPNVLVGDDGAPRVTDFGLAAVEDARTKLTDPGSVMGTPAWMSPEQVLGLPAGPEADVHALGALLYLALTGAGPFEGPNPPAIYRKIVDEEAPWPRKKNIETPAGLEAICLHAMEKDPAARPTAASFADELHRWLAGQPVRSRLPSPAVRLWRRARRNPLAWIGMVAAVAAIAVGASALTIQATRHERERRAKDRAREAQPLASQALLALSAGDEAAAARLMGDCESIMAAAALLDPSVDLSWLEVAQYRRLTGDERGALKALDKARTDDPYVRLERGLVLLSIARREQSRHEELRAQRVRMGGPPEVLNQREGDSLGPAVGELELALQRFGPNPPPSARIAQAELALFDRRFDEATKLVENLDLPEAKLLSGRIEEARGNLDAAIAWYSRAISTRERFWPAWEARAAARALKASLLWKPGSADGDTEQSDAIADWKRLVEALPRRTDYRIALATVAWGLGQMRLYRQTDPTEPCRIAAAAAEAVLAREPLHGEANFAAGRSWAMIAGHMASGGLDASRDYSRAIDHLEIAARVLAMALDVRLELASALRMAGYWNRSAGRAFAKEYERALAVNEDILRLSPQWLPARANQGLMLCELGRWKEAVAAFERAGTWATDDETTRAQFEEAKRRAGE